MPIAITFLAVAAVALLLVALVTILTPWVVAPIKALIRRDPGGSFVAHSQVVRSRWMGGLYGGIGLLLLIAVQPQPFKKSTTVLETAAGSPETQALVARLVAPRVQSGEAIGVVVGIVEPAGTQVFGFGRRKLGAPAPDGQTIYEIGDITRTFTTLLLARMVERGQVTLQQPVRELLPDSVSVPLFADQAITLEQLATDRAGLPSRPGNLPRSPFEWTPPFANPYGGYSAKRLYEFLSSFDLDRKPGAKIATSTLGMGLLGHALGRAGKAGVDTLLARDVCERLGMPDTRIARSRAGDREAQGYVVGMGAFRGWRVASPARRWTYGVLTGASGLHSTANDLLAFLQAHLHLRSSELAWAMDETRRPRYRGRGNEAVALGWSVRLTAPGRLPVTWCSGGTGGTRSWVGMDEARRVGVVVLSSSTLPIDDLGFEILRTLP